MADPVALTDAQWDLLRQARESYDDTAGASYDEVLTEVSGHIRESGSIGKLDIAGVLLWKRAQPKPKWLRQLNDTPEQDVRAITRTVVEAVNDQTSGVPEAAQAGRSALGLLPGFKSGDALASAVMVAAAPQRLAVYERRAEAGLKGLGLELSDEGERYSQYMQVIEGLRVIARLHDHEWLARDVEIALSQLGGRGQD